MADPKNMETFCEKCGLLFMTDDDCPGSLCPDCISGDDNPEQRLSLNGLDNLQSRIEAVIEIYRKQGDSLNIEIIGVLEIIKLNIYQGSLEDEDDE